MVLNGRVDPGKTIEFQIPRTLMEAMRPSPQAAADELLGKWRGSSFSIIS